MNPYPDYQDEELLAALQQGDRKAFDELFRRYWQPLLQQAVNSLPSQEHAEEVVQDLFIKIWNTQTSLRIVNVSYYLHACIRNHCISAIRTLMSEKKNWEYYKNFIPRQDESAETHFIRHETSELWEERISRLPSKTQQIFRMKVLDGLSFRDIETKLHCTRKTIDYHLSKSRELLKTNLSRLGL
ncbi:MAG: hypothetical protein CRN43_12235 [Candidatus Nephrothrix sp. EaCA]|nr:MAG: hypothetical protein CRN43_12235 [Candidatus Nephrothrix sp. EaCA]